MNPLIQTIYLKTIDLTRAVEEEDIEEIETILAERSNLMIEADRFKSADPHFQYSYDEIQLLEKTLILDQQIGKKLAGLLNQNHTQIQQFKKNMQVSMKYQPYSKQTNGVFVDKKN